MIVTVALALAAAAAAAAPTTDQRPLLGEKVALAGWRVAENRATCAPLALASNGGVPASPRLADFSRGWGVAFDSARTRSAYGFAGAGLLPQDKESDAAKRQALAKQWPYTRDVGRTGKLPRGSFAGYGLEGAGRYSRANPRGLNQRSLAYLHIPGQSCLYNVWSKVSRAHLEKVLDSLRLVAGAESADETAIRAQRAAFNDAIARGELAAIGAVLADKALIVTGADSLVFNGKADELRLWREDLAAPSRGIYVRTPDRIEISPVAPMAMETGHYKGVDTKSAKDWSSGTYFAKWRRIGGKWLIESETYMTAACGGSYCPKPERNEAGDR